MLNLDIKLIAIGIEIFWERESFLGWTKQSNRYFGGSGGRQAQQVSININCWKTFPWRRERKESSCFKWKLLENGFGGASDKFHTARCLSANLGCPYNSGRTFLRDGTKRLNYVFRRPSPFYCFFPLPNLCDTLPGCSGMGITCFLVWGQLSFQELSGILVSQKWLHCQNAVFSWGSDFILHDGRALKFWNLLPTSDLSLSFLESICYCSSTTTSFWRLIFRHNFLSEIQNQSCGAHCTQSCIPV